VTDRGKKEKVKTIFYFLFFVTIHLVPLLEGVAGAGPPLRGVVEPLGGGTRGEASPQLNSYIFSFISYEREGN
jgi:hypothetical protein